MHRTSKSGTHLIHLLAGIPDDRGSAGPVHGATRRGSATAVSFTKLFANVGSSRAFNMIGTRRGLSYLRYAFEIHITPSNATIVDVTSAN